MQKTNKIVAALISLVLILTGCSAKPETEAEEVLRPVETVRVTENSIQNVLFYAGQIKPQESVMVVPKIGGKVAEAYFEMGDTVRKGDILFRLDETDVRNQIKQLEAQVNVANQGVNSAQTSYQTATGGQMQSQVLQLETSIENYEKQLQNAKINLENAKLAYEDTKKTYDNTKILYDMGNVPKIDFDNITLLYNQRLSTVEQAEIACEQTEIALNSAKESHDILVNQIMQDTQATARAGVNQAVASRESAATQLAITRETLNDLSVKSPLSGIISSKTIVTGDMVSQASAPYTVVSMDKVIVDVKVSEKIINTIQRGQEVDVLIHTVSSEPIKGILSAVSPSADATSTYPVKIEIDNKDGLIKPGMFGEVHFVYEQSGNTIVVPRNTVMKDQNAQFVYINDNGTAKKVTVETGIDNGKEIEITSGIAIGDEVVVKGQSYLENGDKLNIVSGQ